MTEFCVVRFVNWWVNVTSLKFHWLWMSLSGYLTSELFILCKGEASSPPKWEGHTPAGVVLGAKRQGVWYFNSSHIGFYLTLMVLSHAWHFQVHSLSDSISHENTPWLSFLGQWLLNGKQDLEIQILCPGNHSLVLDPFLPVHVLVASW